MHILAIAALAAALSAPAAGPPTRLRIVFAAEIRNVPSSFAIDLRCGPAGGTAPDPETACRRLAGRPDLLVAPRRRARCGRPPTEWAVTITGVHRARRVRAVFSRCNRKAVQEWMSLLDFAPPRPGV